MNPTTIFCVLVMLSAAWFIWRTAPVDTKKGTTPLTNAQRYQQWKEKMDERDGLESESFLALTAKGTAMKRRKMVEFQTLARRPKSIFNRIFSQPPSIVILNRNGSGPLEEIRRPLEKLSSVDEAPKAPVIIKRGTLRLMK